MSVLVCPPLSHLNQNFQGWNWVSVFIKSSGTLDDSDVHSGQTTAHLGLSLSKLNLLLIKVAFFFSFSGGGRRLGINTFLDKEEAL